MDLTCRRYGLLATTVAFTAAGVAFASAPLQQISNQVTSLYNATLKNDTDVQFLNSGIHDIHANFNGAMACNQLTGFLLITGTALVNSCFIARWVQRMPRDASAEDRSKLITNTFIFTLLGGMSAMGLGLGVLSIANASRLL